MIFITFVTVHGNTADKTMSKCIVTKEYAIQDARTHSVSSHPEMQHCITVFECDSNTPTILLQPCGRLFIFRSPAFRCTYETTGETLHAFSCYFILNHFL
jgi:hypothetical protein